MSPARGSALLIAPIALLLAGCTATGVGGSPTPTPSMPAAVVVSGTGELENPVPLPDGAQSVHVRIVCSDGQFIIDAGGDVGAGRSGMCGGVTELTLAVPSFAPAPLNIRVPAGGAFVAELRFSAEAKQVDKGVTDDCAALSGYYSDVLNAENGYAVGALDTAAWRDRVADGVAKLEAMSPSPMLESAVAILREKAPGITTPGGFTGESADGTPSVGVADSIIGQICSDNGTVIGFVSEYGG